MAVIDSGQIFIFILYLSISILLYFRRQKMEEIGSLRYFVIGYIFLFFENLFSVVEGFFSFFNYLEHLSLAVAVIILAYWLYLFTGGENE